MSKNLSPLDSLRVTNKLIENRIRTATPFENNILNFHIQKGLEALYYYDLDENKGFIELDKFVKLYFKYQSSKTIWENAEKRMTAADAPNFVKAIMHNANNVDKRKNNYEISFGKPIGKMALFVERYFRYARQIHYEQNKIDEGIMNVIYEVDALENKLIDEESWSKIHNPSDLLEYASENNYDSFIDLIMKTSEIFAGDPDIFDPSLYVIKKARMADWGQSMVITDPSFSLPAGLVQRFVEQIVPFNPKTNKAVDAKGNIIKI